MVDSHKTLDAAATERKARLAKLKSLKRKQPDTDADLETPVEPAEEQGSSVTTTYLSGRNYDAATRGPKLGFENAPSRDQDTLENRAQEITVATKAAAAEEEKSEAPIDLFKLQPKKPNWDLKRDLERKMARLNVQTDNMIARMVRERIQAQKQKILEEKKEKGEVLNGHDEVADAGMTGPELLEAMRVSEREEEEEARREKELEEAEYDGL